MHENGIFLNENDIYVYENENFAPGMIFSLNNFHG